MSLRDGTKKMSKSDASDQSRINLTDDADTIAQKIRRAKTDPEPLPSEEKGLEAAAGGRQSRRHLCGAGRDKPRPRCCKEFGGAQFSTFKTALVELRSPSSAPINAEMRRLVADPGLYRLGAGRRRRPRAQAIAAETMKAVKDIVGFVRR